MTTLGKALTLIAKFEVMEDIAHEDVNAFGAPSECHDLVSRGYIKRRRQAVRHARSLSGMSRSAFRRAMGRFYKDFHSVQRLGGILYTKHNPFGGH